MAGEAPPRSQVAVLAVVEAQRREVRKSAAEDLARVKARRDRELNKLDQVVAVLELDPENPEPVAGAVPARSRPKRQARKRPKSAAMEAGVRRDAIHRFLLEQARPAASGEIRRALRLSTSSTTNALKRLIAEGKVTRVGTGAATRYKTRSAAPGAANGRGPERSTENGSAQGRILAMLEERSSATLGELAQALGEPQEEVRGECGRLIREGEIRMARRQGRPVYLRQAVL